MMMKIVVLCVLMLFALCASELATRATAFRFVIPPERGSLDQRFPGAGNAGHWLSYYKSDDTYILYDPSYPNGTYFDEHLIDTIMSDFRFMTRTENVMFYEPMPGHSAVQQDEADTWCQTWSLIQLSGGTWQDELRRVERSEPEDLEPRIDLLKDFIQEWLHRAGRNDLARWFASIKYKFELYFTDANVISAVKNLRIEDETLDQLL